MAHAPPLDSHIYVFAVRVLAQSPKSLHGPRTAAERGVQERHRKHVLLFPRLRALPKGEDARLVLLPRLVLPTWEARTPDIVRV